MFVMMYDDSMPLEFLITGRENFGSFFTNLFHYEVNIGSRMKTGRNLELCGFFESGALLFSVIDHDAGDIANEFGLKSKRVNSFAV